MDKARMTRLITAFARIATLPRLALAAALAVAAALIPVASAPASVSGTERVDRLPSGLGRP